jgi:multicomponent Na+:H+ antiporter subunit G
MGDALHLIGGVLVVAGTLLTLLGSVGVLRFPDVYTRIHAASLTDTGGATLVLLGLALISGLTQETLKLGFVWVFVMLTTPAAANALANAAFSAGHTPRIGAFQIMKGVAAGEAGPETPRRETSDGDKSAAP